MRSPFTTTRGPCHAASGSPRGPGGTVRYEALVQRADTAMYDAKARGGNTYAVRAADKPDLAGGDRSVGVA